MHRFPCPPLSLVPKKRYEASACGHSKHHSPVNLDALGVGVAHFCRLLSQTGMVQRERREECVCTSLSFGVEVAVAVD